MAITLYRRNRSPYWFYDITDPVTGRRVRKTTKRTEKAEAEAVVAVELKNRLDFKQLGFAGEATLGTVLGQYAAKLTVEGCAWDVESMVRKLTGKLEGRSGFDENLPVHFLTTAEVEAHKLRRLQEGASRGTINLELKTVRAAINVARERGIRVGHVKFKLYKVRPKKRIIDEDEEGALLRELDPSRTVRWKDRFGNEGRTCEVSSIVRRQMRDAYDLAVFLLDTGARYNEIATIPWSAIDTRDWKWAMIYRSKVEETDNAIGRLVMTDRLRSILQRRWQGRSNLPYIFAGYSVDADEMTHRGKATGAIRRAMDRAGLNTPDKVQRRGRANVHTFRHTAATRWLRAGMKIEEVQHLLGHASIEQTMEYVTLASDEIAERAAGLMNRAGRQVEATSLGDVLGGVSAADLLKALALVKSGAA